MIRSNQRYLPFFALVGASAAVLLYQLISLSTETTVGQPAVRLTIAPLVLASNTTGQSPRDDGLYQVIAARPLFSPTRQPEVVSQTAMPPAPANLNLVGILHAPNKIFAVARVPGTSNLITIDIGTDVQGWTVTNIGRDRITLKYGPTTQIIALQKGQND
jgi:hypothetical protein